MMQTQLSNYVKNIRDCRPLRNCVIGPKQCVRGFPAGSAARSAGEASSAACSS
jgi:hypothetical protein